MGLFDSDDVVPLITFDGRTYEVNPDAVNHLSAITTPIATVSIAGRYRTGKSFLLNTLCQTNTDTFGVGDTVNACTRGIHIRKTPLQASEQLTVMVMDTEGISSLSAKEDHDVKILSLALLLSSSFIYNSVGAIDDAALQSLNLMTRVSEFIRVDASTSASNEELSSFFPRFYWCLRDFSLRLELENGQPCDQKEYLENSLADSAESGDRNRTRRSIREAFPTRTLLTFPRPAEQTQNLDMHKTSGKFYSAVDELRTKLLSEISPLGAGGFPLTGSMFVRMCESLVDALNRPGHVPTIRDSWSMLAEVQARDVRAQVYAACCNELRQIAEKSASPNIFSKNANGAVETAMKEYTSKLMQKEEGQHELLQQDLEKYVCELTEQSKRLFDKKVEESISILEVAASSEDTTLSLLTDLVRQTMEHLEKDLMFDQYSSDYWKAKCMVRMVNIWLPKLSSWHEKDKEMASYEVEELKSRCTERERDIEGLKLASAQEVERLTRDREIYVASSVATLELQVKAKNEDLEEERQRTNTLDQEVAKQRLLLCELQARVNEHEEQQKAVDVDTVAENSSESDAESEFREFEEKGNVFALESKLRAAHDELREMTSIRDSLLLQCQRETADRESTEISINRRLQSLQTKQDESVARIRSESEETCRKLRDEISLAMEREAEMKKENAALHQQIKSAEQMRVEGESSRQREMRSHQETQISLRALCEDLQVRLVELQKNALSDLRERENEHRRRISAMASDQMNAQVERGEALRREEQSNSEVKELKRRISLHEDMQRDNKKMRFEVQGGATRIENLNAELEKVRGRLDETSNDRERLRTCHIRAESEKAAMQRELELIRVERSIQT